MTYHIQNQETQMPLEKLFINCFWQTNNTGTGTNLTDWTARKLLQIEQNRGDKKFKGNTAACFNQ